MLDDFFVRALLAGIGLALAIVFSFDLVIGILISAALVAFIMFYLDRRGTLPTDTLLGLLAHGGLALGLVILSFFPAMRLDLHALLFGDILAVTRTDLAVIWGGGAIVLGVLWWLWRPLLAATVDADLATVAGLKPERARLIVPAATVRRFAPSPEWMAAGAALAGVVATVGGLDGSATWDTPSGPSIVVAALALFIVTRVRGLQRLGGAR